MTDEALLDVNVLIALAWPQHVHRARVQRWFARRAGCWYSTPVTEAGFLCLSLNRAVIGTETRPGQVLEIIAAFRQDRRHRFLEDDSSLAAPRIALSRFALRRQVTDLHLVNLSAVHGLRLATSDHGIPDMLGPHERSRVELIVE